MRPLRDLSLLIVLSLVLALDTPVLHDPLVRVFFHPIGHAERVVQIVEEPWYRPTHGERLTDPTGDFGDVR